MKRNPIFLVAGIILFIALGLFISKVKKAIAGIEGYEKNY